MNCTDLRIIVVVVSYGSKNDRWLRQLVDEYRHFPCKVQIVVITNVERDLGPNVELIRREPPSDPMYFPYCLREVLFARRGQYDIYIGTEDDVHVRPQNLAAFCQMSRLCPASDVPGFLRFEVSRSSGEVAVHDVHGYFGWGEVREIGGELFAEYENLHSAMYMLTEAQLGVAVDSGRFLEMHSPSRRYGKLEAATTHLYEHCGLRKWFVVSKSDDFLVHHLPDTYADRIGVSKQLFDEYVAAICALGQSEPKRIQFPLATRLENPRFDKTHFEPIRKDVLRIVRPSDRVLWVGSGSGATESALAERGIAISCVPLDSVHASVLRRRSLEVLDCVSVAEVVSECSKGDFSLAVLPEILEHQESPGELIHGLASALRPNGRIFATLPNLGVWRSVYQDRSLVGDREPIGSRVTYNDHLIQPVDTALIRRWFQEAGLKCKIRFRGRRMWLFRVASCGLLSSVIAPNIEVTASRR